MPEARSWQVREWLSHRLSRGRRELDRMRGRGLREWNRARGRGLREWNRVRARVRREWRNTPREQRRTWQLVAVSAATGLVVAVVSVLLAVRDHHPVLGCDQGPDRRSGGLGELDADAVE
ncbi:hypothetical protein ACWEWX_49860, partial [Streptomyces asiaticus]